MTLYLISDVARFFNISSQTLRYYDQIGLLHPGYVDLRTGYRYYTLENFNTLYLIRELKDLGFSLREIQDYCQAKNMQQMERSLKKKRQECLRKISELQKISNRISFYEEALKTLHNGNRKSHCRIETFPVRNAFMIQANFRAEDIRQYIAVAYQSYMSSPDIAQRRERSHVVLIISEENICRREFRIYDGIGILTDRPASGKNNIRFMSGEYAILDHVGGYETTYRSYQKLFSYLQQEGYEAAGCATEVSVTNITMTEQVDQFVTQLQIPIRKRQKN